MKKVEIPLSRSNRLINFGPVVLVTSSFQEKKNIVTVAWVTPISQDPPLVGISISNKHFSNSLIRKSREFIINVPTAELKDKVELCGSLRGEKIDKFKEAGLSPAKAKKISSPLIDECAAHLECRLKDAIDEGDHSIFVGETVYASASTSFLNKDFIVDLNKIRTISHLGGSGFGTLNPI